MENTLNRAREVWNSGSMMRARRIRYKKFTFGDQWSDRVAMPNGTTMTEREYIRRAGYNPVTSNVIRSIVKGVVGYFRSLQSERGAYARFDSTVRETDARTFEEFLISGCAIQRMSRRPGADGRTHVHVEQISPSRFFIDSPGGTTEMLGVLHDFSPDMLMMRFAHGDRRKAARLRAACARQMRDGESMSARRQPLGESVNDTLEFMRCSADGRCRVIEVWTRECGERLKCHDPVTGQLYYADPASEDGLKRENRDRRRSGRDEIIFRWELCPYWQCRFYMPDGTVVDEYAAAMHPFAFCFYPLIDGEIHSFVEDAVEQQRNVNRLLTLNDRMLAVSAKGVLLFPDNQISPSMPLDIVQENWASPDGVVLYRGMPGLPGPQQMVGIGSKFGVDHLIDGQMKMLQEVSGVNGALRGQDPASGTSASLYDSQRKGSAMALGDLVGTFTAYLEERDKIMDALDTEVGNIL